MTNLEALAIHLERAIAVNGRLAAKLVRLANCADKGDQGAQIRFNAGLMELLDETPAKSEGEA
jgi:hypothetical protein